MICDSLVQADIAEGVVVERKTFKLGEEGKVWGEVHQTIVVDSVLLQSGKMCGSVAG